MNYERLIFAAAFGAIQLVGLMVLFQSILGRRNGGASDKMFGVNQNSGPWLPL